MIERRFVRWWRHAALALLGWHQVLVWIGRVVAGQSALLQTRTLRGQLLSRVKGFPGPTDAGSWRWEYGPPGPIKFGSPGAGALTVLDPCTKRPPAYPATPITHRLPARCRPHDIPVERRARVSDTPRDAPNSCQEEASSDYGGRRRPGDSSHDGDSCYATNRCAGGSARRAVGPTLHRQAQGIHIVDGVVLDVGVEVDSPCEANGAWTSNVGCCRSADGARLRPDGECPK